MNTVHILGGTTKQIAQEINDNFTELATGKLDTTAKAVSAGAADSVPWTGVTGKPSVYTPDTHSHADVTTSVSGYMSAADKVKLNGVATGANNYTHPANHPASIITQDSTNRFVTDAEKTTWADKYTKTEVDNKIATVITNLDWKETVATYADITTTYPTPEDGWTVSVKDTDIIYRYNGTSWVTISANSIPLATTSVDGKMSAADKTKLDGIATGANNYVHPSTDGSLHVPATSTVNNGKVLKAGATAGSLAWGTLTAADVGASPTGHAHAFSEVTGKPTTLAGYGITDATPSSHVGTTGAAHGVATTGVNGFMSSTDKSKLDGIATGANNYTHPATHAPSVIAQDASNRFVTDTEKTTWNAKGTASVTTIAFTAADARWGAIANNIYPLTLATTNKDIYKVFRNDGGVYTEVLIGVYVSGSDRVIQSYDKFEGYALCI